MTEFPLSLLVCLLNPAFVIFMLPLVARNRRLSVRLRRVVVVGLFLLSVVDMIYLAFTVSMWASSELEELLLRLTALLPILGLMWSLGNALWILSPYNKSRK